MNAMMVSESLGGPALTPGPAQPCDCGMCRTLPGDVIAALDAALLLGLDTQALARIIGASALEVERHRSRRVVPRSAPSFAAWDDARWKRVRPELQADDLLLALKDCGLRLAVTDGERPSIRVGRATYGGAPVAPPISALIVQREADLIDAIQRAESAERQAREAALRRLRHAVASPSRRHAERESWRQERPAVLRRLRRAERLMIEALEMILSAGDSEYLAAGALRHLSAIVKDEWLPTALVVRAHGEPVFQRTSDGRPVVVGRAPHAKE